MRLAARATWLALLAAGLIVAIGPAVVPPSTVAPPPDTMASTGRISAEAGESIFWGKGRCFTCHSVGERGGERRCPNLGAVDGQPPIGARATARAAALRTKRGGEFSASDYLVESLVNPTAYVVDDYKPEMPAVMKPPLSLAADEVRALTAYLQSLGGTVELAAIRLPSAAQAAAAAAQAWEPYLPGDATRGESIFFDDQRFGCATCHRIGERGGRVGPNLTHVGGVRAPRELVRSILEPSVEITNGFQGVEVETADSESLTGTLVHEDDAQITLALASGNERTIATGHIVVRSSAKLSLMPGNFAELLTVSDLHDLLAFLTAQR